MQPILIWIPIQIKVLHVNRTIYRELLKLRLGMQLPHNTHYTALHYHTTPTIPLYCTALTHNTLYCTVLPHNTHYTALHYHTTPTILHCITTQHPLYCTALPHNTHYTATQHPLYHYTALHYHTTPTILHCIGKSIYLLHYTT